MPAAEFPWRDRRRGESCQIDRDFDQFVKFNGLSAPFSIYQAAIHNTYPATRKHLNCLCVPHRHFDW
ncbi:MAG: hypothetical protein VXW27_10215, partial [Pseudomonadota bacterium]|nr:hypothetical protein [Pseudomonadota bacterium]